MGSPQSPGPQQVAQLEKAGQLAMLEKPVKVKNGTFEVDMRLPRQGVSLLLVSYK